MDFSVISLIVLVVVVAIGFIKKVNLGFLSLGRCVYSRYLRRHERQGNCRRFQQLHVRHTSGCYFLFGMASANGTLELFSNEGCGSGW